MMIDNGDDDDGDFDEDEEILRMCQEAPFEIFKELPKTMFSQERFVRST